MGGGAREGFPVVHLWIFQLSTVFVPLCVGLAAPGVSRSANKMVFSGTMKIHQGNCSVLRAIPFISDSCLAIPVTDRERMLEEDLHVCSVTCSDTDAGIGHVTCFQGKFLDIFKCDEIPSHVIKESSLQTLVEVAESGSLLKASPPKDTQPPLLKCPPPTKHFIPSSLVGDPDVYGWPDPTAIDARVSIIVPRKTKLFNGNSASVTYSACDKAGNCASCTVVVAVNTIITEPELDVVNINSLFIISIVMTTCLIMVMFLRQRVIYVNYMKKIPTVI